MGSYTIIPTTDELATPSQQASYVAQLASNCESFIWNIRFSWAKWQGANQQLWHPVLDSCLAPVRFTHTDLATYVGSLCTMKFGHYAFLKIQRGGRVLRGGLRFEKQEPGDACGDVNIVLDVVHSQLSDFSSSPHHPLLSSLCFLSDDRSDSYLSDLQDSLQRVTKLQVYSLQDVVVQTLQNLMTEDSQWHSVARDVLQDSYLISTIYDYIFAQADVHIGHRKGSRVVRQMLSESSRG